jgi:hypothetical protein
MRDSTDDYQIYPPRPDRLAPRRVDMLASTFFRQAMHVLLLSTRGAQATSLPRRRVVSLIDSVLAI